MTPRILAIALATALTCGCSMAPQWQRPAAAVPAALPQGAAYQPLTAGDGAIDAIGWHDFFRDARLQRVIATALDQNRDLRVTVANVAAARAQFRIARAPELPTLTVAPAASHYHGSVSTNGYTSGNGASANGADSDAFGVSGGLAGFEIDLWGRVRNLGRAGLESWLSSDEGRKAATITLIDNVATAWLTVGADADALSVAQAALANRDRSLELARKREALGVGTALEVAQADTLAETARGDVAAYTTALAQATNALALLVGQAVPAQDLPSSLPDDAVLPALPVGLSSDVLLRRPDVLSAEHGLRAADANLGAARAALFPTISLTGLVGLASGSLGGLFDGSGTFNYGLGASATQTLFDNGAKAGNVALARARRDAAVAGYERAVQGAFSDVANALARRGTIESQLGAAGALAASADQAARIIRARAQNGIDSDIAALDAERTVYAAQQTLVITRLARATNMVTLYAVLGGGLKP